VESPSLLKKPAFAALAVFAFASLAALAQTTPPSPDQPASKPAFKSMAAGTPPVAMRTLPDTLAVIKSAKQINVAFSGDSLPFSVVGKDNRPTGYSIDLCNRVIAHLGRVVGVPDLKVNWLVGTAAERVDMVAAGKAQLDCANTTASRTRMKSVDFSSLVFLDGGGMIVKSAAGLQKFSDLAGKRIGVIAGTTTEARLDAMLAQKLVNAKVTRLKDGTEGIAMLESGSLDALASDKIKLIGLAVQAKHPEELTMLQEDLSIEPIAFGLPRNDSSFRLEVNTALTQVYLGGEIDTIFTQWFGTLGRPSGLLAAMYLLNSLPE
jgi:polar amino acid transport system substrate-binding protein/glutamate/aspartate transport system substrate-binding protein